MTTQQPDPFDRGMAWALATLATCLWALWTLALVDLIGGEETAWGPVMFIPIADLPLTVGLLVARRTRRANREATR